MIYGYILIYDSTGFIAKVLFHCHWGTTNLSLLLISSISNGCQTHHLIEIVMAATSFIGKKHESAEMEYSFVTIALVFPILLQMSFGSFSIMKNHHMEIFSAFMCLCERNHLWSMDSPRKALMILCFWLFFDVSQNKLLNKQLIWSWLQRPWHSCDNTIMLIHL